MVFNLTMELPTRECHSLLSHYPPLYHKFCRQCKPPKKSTHTLTLRDVSSICGLSSSSSSSATCWMLVHAYATSPGKAKWSGPHRRNWEENEFKFQNVTCYTNSIISLIHVDTARLRDITCTLVATCVIQRSLGCHMFNCVFTLDNVGGGTPRYMACLQIAHWGRA